MQGQGKKSKRRAGEQRDDSNQSERFMKTAREIGADESEAAFDAKLAGIAKGKPLSMDQIKKLVSERKKQK